MPTCCSVDATGDGRRWRTSILEPTLVRLCIRGDDTSKSAAGLTNPTSVAIGPDSDAYISNFGTSLAIGEVIRVDLPR